jgi:N-acetylneuraminic acid mutarotase
MRFGKLRFQASYSCICAVALAVTAMSASAQSSSSNEWTWMGGSNIVPSAFGYEAGVYGALGTPAAGNIPGGRSDAVSWTDRQGNLWMFGGLLFTSGLNYFNDLWEFNPSANEWTWMGGSNTFGSNCPVISSLANCGQLGVYGTMGTAAAGNVPGGRYQTTSWTDNNGHLWLFGGLGFDSVGNWGALNDLWKFDPATKEWTWVAGSNTVPVNSACNSCILGQPAVYGTLGAQAAGNTPGGVWGSSSWTDKSGNLWLFGGLGMGLGGNSGVLNELWEFTPSTGEWGWMSGSNLIPFNSTGENGVYGTLGTPGPENVPGGRLDAATWLGANGTLWLFGGDGYDDDTNFGALNDLWEFDPATSQWAWMSGSAKNSCAAYGQSNCGLPGVFGTLGTAAAGNVPGSRFVTSAWTDSNGHFWLFGGKGFDASGSLNYLNDLWQFDPATVEWTWMGGENDDQVSAGIYGTLGTAAAQNLPGARQDSTSWTDNNGNFWLFGGAGYDSVGIYGYLNDVWVYQPADSTTLPEPDFAIALSPTSATVPGGQIATTTISITPANGFNAAVSFRCSGLPSGSSCSFSPVTVTPSGGAISTTLTVTTAVQTAVAGRNGSALLPMSALAGILCCIGFRRRVRLHLVLLLVLGSAGLTALSGCGTSYNPQPVQPVTSTVTVTATSGTLSHTTTFSLTVN